jgi:hypothetical protein
VPLDVRVVVVAHQLDDRLAQGAAVGIEFA